MHLSFSVSYFRILHSSDFGSQFVNRSFAQVWGQLEYLSPCKHVEEAAHALFGSSAALWKAIFAATTIAEQELSYHRMVVILVEITQSLVNRKCSKNNFWNVDRSIGIFMES